jgi:LEA14-like dessication related protein
MKHKIRAATISLIVLILSALTAQAQEAKPAAEFRGVAINQINWLKQTADATVTVEITNPGPALKLKDVDYRLKFNDEQVAEGKSDKEFDLSAASKTSIELPLTINLRALPSAAWNAVTDSMTLHYEIDTGFTVALFSINSGKIKTTFTGDVPMSKIISALSYKIKQALTGKP